MNATMPQWIIDLAAAQDLRDADQKWRHRSWKLINRMHTTINDLRNEVKVQRELNIALLELAGQDTPTPPADYRPDTTIEEYIL